MTIAQPGTWASPVTPEMLSQAGVSMGFTQTFNGDVFWDESRPNENGRNVVVSRTNGDLASALERFNSSARNGRPKLAGLHLE